MRRGWQGSNSHCLQHEYGGTKLKPILEVQGGQLIMLDWDRRAHVEAQGYWSRIGIAQTKSDSDKNKSRGYNYRCESVRLSQTFLSKKLGLSGIFHYNLYFTHEYKVQRQPSVMT